MPDDRSVSGRAKGSRFEAIVQQVIAGLDICRNGKLYRNRQYNGVRQPGSYEIDISVEFTAGDALYFLVIVECKDWSKPVDRPAIQKLIQTRDAIAAHKAAIASAVGFSEEAIAVAQANGVACWVVDGRLKIVCRARIEYSGELIALWQQLRNDFVRVVERQLGIYSVGLSSLRNLLQVQHWVAPSSAIRETIRDSWDGGGWYDRDDGELFSAYVSALRRMNKDHPQAEVLYAWEASARTLLIERGIADMIAEQFLASVYENDRYMLFGLTGQIMH